MNKRIIPIFFPALLALGGVLLTGCEQEDIPLYQPKPAVSTRNVGFYFQDKSNATANIAIYINNRLLTSEGQTRGLLTFGIPDSLQRRTFTVALAEYGGSAPAQVDPDRILFETLLFPDELPTLTSVLMTRDNDQDSVTVTKLIISEEEAPPAPGYFKVQFYNVTTDTFSIETRNGEVVKGYESLRGFENKGFIELRFGNYRFASRNKNGDVLRAPDPPVYLSGAAGKAYTVLLSAERQQVIEVKDFGVPATPFGYIGFMNLIPGQEAVSLALTAGSVHAEAEHSYAVYSGLQLVPSGKFQLRATGLPEEVTAESTVGPWEQVMVYLVEENGVPQIHVVHNPIPEVANEYNVFARFLNFSPDAGEVSFGQKRADANTGSPQDPVYLVSSALANNLSFGEVVIPATENAVNTPYVIFSIYNAPVELQAHRAAESPLALNDYIAGTELQSPLYFVPGTVPYPGRSAQAGTYSVILVGRATGDVPEAQRTRLLVIPHSF